MRNVSSWLRIVVVLSAVVILGFSMMPGDEYAEKQTRRKKKIGETDVRQDSVIVRPAPKPYEAPPDSLVSSDYANSLPKFTESPDSLVEESGQVTKSKPKAFSVPPDSILDPSATTFGEVTEKETFPPLPGLVVPETDDEETTEEEEEKKKGKVSEDDGDGEGGDTFIEEVVDNSTTLNWMTKFFGPLTSVDNRFITFNNQTSMESHVQNNIDNRRYTIGADENALAVVAGDLVDATAAIGLATAGLTVLTGALPGMLGAALLGAVGGLAAGVGRGVTQGGTEVTVEVPEVDLSSLGVADDGRYVGFGGGNAPDINCEQLLQEWLAAGKDASDIPEPCRSILQL